ncbi:Protein of unknown function DUF3468 [Penicillium sp. IBT 18751x]|nr:Protein of unknown function DUF3468 [Penicillium sp. IBT 18751x]
MAKESLLLNVENVLKRPYSKTSVLARALRIFCQTIRVVRAARISSRTRGKEIDLSLFDLVSIEVYRYAALLQIYNIFSDILDKRLLLSKRPRDELLALFVLIFPTADENQVRSVEEARRILALQIFSFPDRLPATSGTRCMHPILLACVSSDLMYSTQSLVGPEANDIPRLSALDVEIAQAKRETSLWLLELSLILPKLRLQRVSKYVHATWDVADCAMTQYWLGTMIDRNLETILG